jgi:hypothetical protein
MKKRTSLFRQTLNLEQTTNISKEKKFDVLAKLQTLNPKKMMRKLKEKNFIVPTNPKP